MKKMIWLMLAALVLGLAASAFAQLGAFEPKVEQIKVNDHLYEFVVTYNFEVSLIASIGEDGILLVDTGFEQTADILNTTLRNISKANIKYVINSHEHSDHTGGNLVFG